MRLRILAIFFALRLGVPSLAQEAMRGTVRLYALTEIGKPLDQAKVRIQGTSSTQTVDVRGPTSVDLEYGVYTLACLHSTLATQFKVVRVEKAAPIDVVFGLPVANPGQVTGEGDFSPFEVSGRVTPVPTGAFSRIKAVGIFTEDTADSKVDDRGRFRLLLRNEGVYRIFVLVGNDIAHEHTVDLTYAMPRQVSLELRINRKAPAAK